MKLRLFKNNIQFKDIRLPMLLAFILSLPITGFLYGFISANVSGQNLIFAFLGRFFCGILYTFITTLTLGKPRLAEGGSAHVDVTAYVFLTFFILSILIIIKELYNKSKHNA